MTAPGDNIFSTITQSLVTAGCTDGQLVAIDGKTARATLDRAKGKNPLHIVSAWAAENRLFLGQGECDRLPVVGELHRRGLNAGRDDVGVGVQ